MIIAQISDLHVDATTDSPHADNYARLNRVLDSLLNGVNQPDLLLVTGDITEHGDDTSYALYAKAMERCTFPVWPVVGNHDHRGNFLRFFPQYVDENGFVQYIIDLDEFRLVIIDSVEDGLHGGAFCSTRAAWLDKQLAATDKPVYIVMHHPPIATGIDWMDPRADELWVQRLSAAIEPHKHVMGIFCGHVHRSTTLNWNGRVVVICPSSAPRIALDLRKIDTAAPDGRTMISKEIPAYALHRWNGHSLVTFFCAAQDYESIAQYDTSMQHFLRYKDQERRRNQAQAELGAGIGDIGSVSKS